MLTVVAPACSWSLVLPSNTDASHWGYYTDNFLDPAADPEKWGAALLQVCCGLSSI